MKPTPTPKFQIAGAGFKPDRRLCQGPPYPSARNANAVLNDSRACTRSHGLLASPAELRSFGEALRDEGFPVIGVRLAGHGTSPWDLRDRSWQDWIRRRSSSGRFSCVQRILGCQHRFARSHLEQSCFVRERNWFRELIGHICCRRHCRASVCFRFVAHSSR